MSKLGRPLLFDARVTDRVQFRLTPEQHRDLQRIAQQNQTTVVGVVRDAVNEYVADQRDVRCFVRQNPKESPE